MDQTRLLPFARWIAWLAFATRLVLFDTLEILRARSINDYGSFHAAAYAIRAGLDPYRPEDLAKAAEATQLGSLHPYFYPPFLAELLVPMTTLSVFPARLVWHVLTVAAFCASMALLDRWLVRVLAGAPALDTARTVFAIVMCMFWPIRASQWMAQVNGIVLLLLVVWWTERDRWKWAGLALGAAAAIKMSPLLLVLIPLSQRRVRESIVAAASAGVLVLGSCAILGRRGLGFLHDVLFSFVPGHAYHGLTVPVDVPGNHSIGAFAFWLFDHQRSVDHLHLSKEAVVMQLVVIALLILAWGVGVFRAMSVEARVASLIVVMIIAPTYAFEHHVAFSAIAIAALLVLLARRQLHPLAVAVLLLSLALLTEPEGSFALPDGKMLLVWRALSCTPKLVPLVVLYLVALTSHRVPRADEREGDSAPASPASSAARS